MLNRLFWLAVVAVFIGGAGCGGDAAGSKAAPANATDEAVCADAAGTGGGQTSATATAGFKALYPIALHAGSGSVPLTITNTGAAPIALTAGPVLDSATHSVIDGAVGTALPNSAGAAPASPVSIAPGQTLTIQAKVTGVTGASAAEFSLYDKDTALGTVYAVAGDAPLAVTVDGDGGADKTLAYTDGKPVEIALKNGDPQSYHLQWRFEVANERVGCGVVDLPRSGSGSIRFTPGATAFSWLDAIHPSNKKGVLLLGFKVQPGLTTGPLPDRSLAVALAMQRLSPVWTTVWSYVYVSILLLFGGMFSYLASALLPNIQKKGNLRTQLLDLAKRTSQVSTLCDSYLRVLLRLERSRIENLISGASWVFVSDAPLTLASAGIDTLSNRLTAAEKLDDLRRKHAQISATAPPSVSDSIDSFLQSAADQLHSTALTQADLDATNAFFAQAQAAIEKLNDSDAMAAQVAGNLAAVITRIAKFPPNYYADLKEALPGLFFLVDKERGFSDPKAIVRPMFFAIDHAAAAIQLVLDYAMVRASIPMKPDPARAPVAPAAAPVADAAPAARVAAPGGNAPLAAPVAAPVVAPVVAPVAAAPAAGNVAAPEAPPADAPPEVPGLLPGNARSLGSLHGNVC